VDVVTGTIGLDSRIGRKYLTGATAYGGLTFPLAISSLLNVAESAGIKLRLIKAVASMNQWQNERLAETVRDWWEQSEAERIGILGLAYKPGISATEGSVGLALMELLHPLDIIVYDPAVQIKQSVGSAQTCADWSDIIVVATPWPEFKGVQFHEGQVVIDCWRMYDRQTMERQGVHYVAIGVGPCERSLWSPARAASSGATWSAT
jgi:UDPglucose 6-dehydrogenase